MSEELKLCIAVLLTNMIIIALFIFLAISFNHWWIALFAMLFTRGVKTTSSEEEEPNKNNE